jgi:hypothetical protein
MVHVPNLRPHVNGITGKASGRRPSGIKVSHAPEPCVRELALSSYGMPCHQPRRLIGHKSQFESEDSDFLNLRARLVDPVARVP